MSSAGLRMLVVRVDNLCAKREAGAAVSLAGELRIGRVKMRCHRTGTPRKLAP